MRTENEILKVREKLSDKYDEVRKNCIVLNTKDGSEILIISEELKSIGLEISSLDWVLAKQVKPAWANLMASDIIKIK